MLCNLLLRRLSEELKPIMTAFESSKQSGLNEAVERDQYVTSFFTQVRTRVITRSSNCTVSVDRRQHLSVHLVSLFAVLCFSLHVANVLMYPSFSPITHGSSSSSSSPSSRSPLASSLTRSVFHSELKTWLFGNHFLHRPFPFLLD